MRKQTSGSLRRAPAKAMPAATVPFMQVQAPITQLWGQLGQRMADFAQVRGSKLMHANSDILQAKDPAAVMDAQTRYVRELVEDYSGETAAIAETCTKCLMHAYDGRTRSR